jgi:hypothetical protein
MNVMMRVRVLAPGTTPILLIAFFIETTMVLLLMRIAVYYFALRTSRIAHQAFLIIQGEAAKPAKASAKPPSNKTKTSLQVSS